MTTYTGNSGVVTFSGNVVGEVREFMYSSDAPPLENTKLTATNRTYLAGLPEIKGTVSCWYDPGDSTGQVAMATALAAGSSVTLVLRPLGTGSGKVQETGTVVITSRKNSVKFQEVNTIDFDFFASGAFVTSNQP